MKLSNISIIFIIIVLPIILLLSYYVSLQTDTINMQTAYTTKQVDATKEAIEAFEINTVEWNDSYSGNADSKRRDIMASIDTFTTSFANSVGVGGTNKENILTYIPAIAVTLYDGYYIYTPSEIKQVIKDENGVAVFLKEKIVKPEDSSPITGYEYNVADEGKLLYKYDSENGKGIDPDGMYNGTAFTLNEEGAKSTYEHILKPYSTYSARYKTNDGKIDITVDYTLDSYITIYGTIWNEEAGEKEYVVKSGYLIAQQDELKSANEYLSEKVAWKSVEDGSYTCQEYYYVYAEDNTKVYFDGDTTFQVSSTGIRTNLNETTSVKYKKIRTSSERVIYQALNSGYEKSYAEEPIEIQQGQIYRDKNGTTYDDAEEYNDIRVDYSSRNYYIESIAFTKWVQENLSGIKIGNMQVPDSEKSKYGDLNKAIFISEDPESEDSDINRHKREIIKQTLINNLNQSITSYSRNTDKEYSLPILKETDWDHVFRNVSIITFLQDMPIGMKKYNNYSIATSTSNREYVNPDEMYFINDTSDIYYHLPYCSKMFEDGSSDIIGYKNIDYVVESYEEDDEIKYYYKHPKNQACYYCIVQRDLYEKYEGDADVEEDIEYYKNVALARERYRNISKINLEENLKYNIRVSFDLNGGEYSPSSAVTGDKYVALGARYKER